ncbi:glycogen debranching protein [Saccharomonospora sp. CUA-673]|nr:glycogen debranching protein [Saccharomonospora sp. CUA-673]OLT48028.1 glycogen debranching protein [Saccharomonospora sp. CUA-673]
MVLRDNDTGNLVTASPRLYPHMWSWDAAFISMGLAHLDVARATRELDTLLAAQWRDGMIPHIVFTGDNDYFPGPDRWGTDDAPQRPDGVRTSGICQPPVHAIALRRIIDTARRTSAADAVVAQGFAARAWDALYRWHRWIVRHRMPGDAHGLVTIVHGWESGMDNSPRWDSAYAGVHPGPDLPPYVRLDVLKVDDPGERPSDDEYDRYLWLIEQMRRADYNPDKVVETSAFLVGDVFITAVFALASDNLAEVGEEIGADAEQVAELRGWAERARAATAASCDPDTGMARDRDVRAGRWVATDSIAGFSPLLCGGLPADVEQQLIATLDSPRWSGHPDLLAAVPTSVSPDSPDFDPRQYWRGPQWPVVTWLFGWAFGRRGWERHASEFRAQGVYLASDGAFGEYYEPFTGKPLGSTNQSWTAAVVLDWLCSV